MNIEEIGNIITNNNSSSSTSSRCQDCGNQAKKDCQHSRCRTCCNNRGFHCQTHVTSTWIPVSRRRRTGGDHREMHHHHQISSASLDLHGPTNPNRYRENPALGLQGERNFPAEMSFPAMFRCVRVNSSDNVVDQYAYQSSVSIGGHIFTGILYDQGRRLLPEPPEGTRNYVAEESSSAASALLRHRTFVTGTTAGAAASAFPSPFLAFTNNSSSQFFQYPKS